MKVKEIVHRCSVWELERSFVELGKLICDMQDKIPEQYLPHAEVELDIGEYGGMLNVVYEREETEVEKQAREEKAKILSENTKQKRYKEYLELKREFEGDNSMHTFMDE